MCSPSKPLSQAYTPLPAIHATQNRTSNPTLSATTSTSPTQQQETHSTAPFNFLNNANKTKSNQTTPSTEEYGPTSRSSRELPAQVSPLFALYSTSHPLEAVVLVVVVITIYIPIPNRGVNFEQEPERERGHGSWKIQLPLRIPICPRHLP